ncbi:sugar ABC transporter permease [Kitasatospora nipponensis]|uniref:carbohydrate ABC transporter permease n=1 Tax=Kitasatospora nipponensis TaxID=258049 RepID=UPI0031E16254
MPRPPSSSTPGRAGERVLAWAFLLPSLVVFALFLGYPLYRTLYLSAHGNDLFGAPSQYVGLRHYTDLLTSAAFARTLTTTALFVLLTVLPGVLGALLLVLLLESRIRGVRLLRSAFALPFAFSVASASVVFGVFYNPATGVLNGLLSRLGAGPVDWLTDARWALPSVAAATIWMNLGYNVLVLSAGLGSITPEITEAARLDGASGWRLARSVTVPLLGPHLFFLVVVSTINALQSFGQINILTQGGPDGASRTLVYSVYEKAFAYGSSDFGTASAQAVVLLLVVLACTAVQFGVVERKVHYT